MVKASENSRLTRLAHRPRDSLWAPGRGPSPAPGRVLRRFDALRDWMAEVEDNLRKTAR